MSWAQEVSCCTISRPNTTGLRHRKIEARTEKKNTDSKTRVIQNRVHILRPGQNSRAKIHTDVRHRIAKRISECMNNQRAGATASKHNYQMRQTCEIKMLRACKRHRKHNRYTYATKQIVSIHAHAKPYPDRKRKTLCVRCVCMYSEQEKYMYHIEDPVTCIYHGGMKTSGDNCAQERLACLFPIYPYIQSTQQ